MHHSKTDVECLYLTRNTGVRTLIQLEMIISLFNFFFIFSSVTCRASQFCPFGNIGSPCSNWVLEVKDGIEDLWLLVNTRRNDNLLDLCLFSSYSQQESYFLCPNVIIPITIDTPLCLFVILVNVSSNNCSLTEWCTL